MRNRRGAANFLDGCDATPIAQQRHAVYRAMVYRHEAFGILVLTTMGLRIIWRLFDERPAFPVTMRRWETVASALVHGSLYVLALASCILGWYQVSSNGTDVNVFGWKGLPRLTGKDEHFHSIIAFWHQWISWIFVGMVVFHIAAALKHHFVDRDRVLRGMLPFNR